MKWIPVEVLGREKLTEADNLIALLDEVLDWNLTSAYYIEHMINFSGIRTDAAGVEATRVGEANLLRNESVNGFGKQGGQGGRG